MMNIFITFTSIFILVVYISFAGIAFDYIKERISNRKSIVDNPGIKNSFIDTVFYKIRDSKKVIPLRYRKFIPFITLAIIIITSYYSYYNFKSIMPNGTYCFIVEASMFDENYDVLTKYRLPAEVHARNESLYDESYYEDNSDVLFRGSKFPVVINNMIFYLWGAYFPNGTFLEFDVDQVEFYQEAYNTDQYGNEWVYTLTTERASHPKIIEEFEPVSKKDMYYTAVSNLILTFYLFVWACKYKKGSFPEDNCRYSETSEGMGNAK